jgi:hypothetical protein
MDFQSVVRMPRRAAGEAYVVGQRGFTLGGTLTRFRYDGHLIS